MMQSIKLSMIPSGVPPVLHVSQSDTGREIAAEITDAPSSWGGITGVLETDVASCDCTLQSATNTFTCTLPVSITSHACMHRAQLALHSGTAVTRSAVFLIDIEQGAKTE
jgi:hypothetical protein